MDTTELITYLLTPAAQVLLIMAIAELVKRLNLFDKKFIQLIKASISTQQTDLDLLLEEYGRQQPSAQE